MRDEQIAAPWVIVGLPRTGTSLLSILLGPRSRWPARCCSGRRPIPIPPPTLEGAAEDPRIAQTAKELDGLMKLNPPLKAMHPFGATIAQECVSLFMYDVRTLALETQAHVPTYARWLEQADMTPAYAQHRLALQTLQSRQPTQRWILKTPNHLWHLDALLDAYPDARIIWTHRDPGPVVTSLASLANAGPAPAHVAHRSPPDGRGVEAQVPVRARVGHGLRRPDRRPAGASTSATTPWSPIRSAPSPRSTPRSARRSPTCTPGACGPGWRTGRRTPSATTATTPPTSGGPTTAWPTSSSDYTDRYLAT